MIYYKNWILVTMLEPHNVERELKRYEFVAGLHEIGRELVELVLV